VQSESTDPNLPRAFRICQNCGQPTPAQLTQCASCGARSVQNVVIEQQAKAERHFLNALFSRATPVTYTILIFNFAIYILMALVSGENFLETFVFMSDPLTLIAFGAKTNELLANGEWFRFITPIFIHGGLLHLASNSYAIWVIGPVAEKLYGSARFLLIYLLAGIGGVIGSYIGGMGRPAWIPGVGASGAIFGLFGLLFVFGYRYRDELPANFRRAVTTGMLPVILINLFIGYYIPAIDNAAHIGGLITGGILGFVIPYIAPGRARVSRLGLAIFVACVALVAYSFARAYQTSGAYLLSPFDRESPQIR
jgi:rhomboid protease GluP